MAVPAVPLALITGLSPAEVELDRELSNLDDGLVQLKQATLHRIVNRGQEEGSFIFEELESILEAYEESLSSVHHRIESKLPGEFLHTEAQTKTGIDELQDGLHEAEAAYLASQQHVSELEVRAQEAQTKYGQIQISTYRKSANHAFEAKTGISTPCSTCTIDSSDEGAAAFEAAKASSDWIVALTNHKQVDGNYRQISTLLEMKLKIKNHTSRAPDALQSPQGAKTFLLQAKCKYNAIKTTFNLLQSFFSECCKLKESACLGNWSALPSNLLKALPQIQSSIVMRKMPEPNTHFREVLGQLSQDLRHRRQELQMLEKLDTWLLAVSSLASEMPPCLHKLEEATNKQFENILDLTTNVPDATQLEPALSFVVANLRACLRLTRQVGQQFKDSKRRLRAESVFEEVVKHVGSMSGSKEVMIRLNELQIAASYQQHAEREYEKSLDDFSEETQQCELKDFLNLVSLKVKMHKEARKALCEAMESVFQKQSELHRIQQQHSCASYQDIFDGRQCMQRLPQLLLEYSLQVTVAIDSMVNSVENCARLIRSVLGFLDPCHFVEAIPMIQVLLRRVNMTL
eukprot:Skav215122  [mRNA]  locus=scaffold1893:369798:371519:- [translate_table: standard]